MQPDDITKFDKLQKSLFDDSVALTEKDLEIRKRYQAVFVIWLENPVWSDKDIIRYMRQSMNLGKTQAYEDLQKIKIMLGNVRNASKEWQRFRVIEMCLETYNMAKKRGDIKAMAMATDKLGKYTKLDKDDIENPNWGNIIPPILEPTSDPSVLGVTRTPEFKKRVEKLKRQYLGEDLIVEDADVIDE
jgi:hypothetical protein